MAFALMTAIQDYVAGVYFVLLFPAVHVVSLICGVGPGIAATAASGLLAAWAFIPPHYSLSIQPSEGVKVLAFYLACTPTLAVVRLFHRYVQKLDQEKQLTASLLREKEKHIQEKNVLIQEVHHRTKNNLQIISALIRMSGQRGNAQGHQSALARIQAMAHVHEILYKAEDLSTIHLSDYLDCLFRQFRDGDQNALFAFEGVDIPLDMDSAVPLALLINEAITNCLKYGRTNDDRVNVRVRIEKQEQDLYGITISDQGPGWPDGFDQSVKGTLGFQLIASLARQLSAQLHCWNDGGARLRITVPIPAHG